MSTQTNEKRMSKSGKQQIILEERCDEKVVFGGFETFCSILTRCELTSVICSFKLILILR